MSSPAISAETAGRSSRTSPLNGRRPTRTAGPSRLTTPSSALAASDRASGGAVDREPRLPRGLEQRLVVGDERHQVAPDGQRGGEVNRPGGAEPGGRQGRRGFEHVVAERDPADPPDDPLAAGERTGLCEPDGPQHLGPV